MIAATQRNKEYRWVWLIFAALVLCVVRSVPCQAQLTQIQGRYVTVHTDLPVTNAINELPKAFDAAVPLWCQFFGANVQQLGQWHVTAYLMINREAFQQRGLLTPNVPNFAHGYQMGETVWVVNQPSDYYTRHLLLHEGVHAVMERLFGGAGPAWYMEGTAELLATHRWNAGQMTTPVVPESRGAFPYWGRLKILNDARSSGSGILSIDAVLNYSQKAHRSVEPYAWSWAALTLMQQYPRYRDVAANAAVRGAQPFADFTRAFRSELKTDWSALRLRWQMLLEDVDYGFDLERNRIDLPNAQQWNGSEKKLQVAADRGWQSSGLVVSAGQQIQIDAAGEFIIGDKPKPWRCQPGGVTIEYHRGRPIGMLLAAIAPMQTAPNRYIARPQVEGIGYGKTIRPDQGGLLLLRIGDDPSRLRDNSGVASVTISTPQQ